MSAAGTIPLAVYRLLKLSMLFYLSPFQRFKYEQSAPLSDFFYWNTPDSTVLEKSLSYPRDAVQMFPAYSHRIVSNSVTFSKRKVTYLLFQVVSERYL